MPLWTKRQKREVMRSIRHWQIAEFIRQWHKKSRIYHQPDCLHSDICGGISGSSYYFECAGSGGEASGSERNQPVPWNAGRQHKGISHCLGGILSDTYYGSHRFGHAAGDIYRRK